MILGDHRTMPGAAMLLALCCGARAGQDLPAAGEPPLAQSRPDEKTLIASRDRKLQSDFLKKTAWVTDL